MNKKKIYKTLAVVAGISVVVLLAWYFKFITCCIVLAIILSLIGNPLMQMFQRIRIGKVRMGKNISAISTLLIILGVLFMLLYWFFPMLFSQAIQLASMDTTNIVQYAEKCSSIAKQYLIDYGLIEAEASLEAMINKELLNALKTTRFDIIFSDIFSATVDLFLGIFVTLFITFFFLRDKDYITKLIYSAVPLDYVDETEHVLKNSRYLISRYFIGLLCEILLVTLLLFVGFRFSGFPNALLLAFCCGILVIVPYVGAIIGSLISYLILLASMISGGVGFEIMPLTLTYGGIFIGVKLIDDFVIQPFIYSKSVKAHPLEIFLVILIAGEVGGILGMIIAIPLYTLMRIIVKEFYSNSRFVQNFIRGF
ncbi:MAG: AI-2E family transporter [Bacteroidales bacterium]|nr:AI-2E family transporter [Bacteroidales bacterium]